MNARIEFSTAFTAGVHWDDRLLMNNYSLKLYMITNCADNLSQNIALERIKYFIYSQMNSTVFINRDNLETCQKFSEVGLKITTLPSEPVDQIIGIMLYLKLNAIMENRMVINEVELSSDLGENINYLHAADENLGPLDESGWWHNADLVHYDSSLLSNDKVVDLHHVGAWRELDLAWPDVGNTDPTDNTVVFAEFKNNETK